MHIKLPIIVPFKTTLRVTNKKLDHNAAVTFLHRENKKSIRSLELKESFDSEHISSESIQAYKSNFRTRCFSNQALLASLAEVNI